MLLTNEIRGYVGLESALEIACDSVERGAVRRYCQAIMDEDPIYWDAEAAARFNGPVASPIFPMDLFRRPFGTEDPVRKYADDPDFDGVGPPSSQGLPPIEPLKHFGVLTGGYEIEFYRYAIHGEGVAVKQRYDSITEKQGKKGGMIFVVVRADYTTLEGELLIRAYSSTIWRPNA